MEFWIALPVSINENLYDKTWKSLIISNGVQFILPIISSLPFYFYFNHLNIYKQPTFRKISYEISSRDFALIKIVFALEFQLLMKIRS